MKTLINPGIACVFLLLMALSGSALAADMPQNCASESEDSRRLACYDKAFQQAPMPVVKSVPSPEADPGKPLAVTDSGHASSILGKFWELGPDDKRSTFVVRTYLPNFLLPLQYSSSINRAPSSPTHPASVNHPDYRPVEAKMQISLRAKVVEDLLLPGADLWVAYTQQSLWQIWDSKDSSPFRSTDYQPEVIYVVPVPEQFGKLPLGWNLRLVQLGFAHQSNGQSDPLSRSWNRITVGAGFEHGDFSLRLRGNQRLDVKSKDDNPDLADYIGRGEVNLAWVPGLSTVSLTWRTTFKSANRGSLQLDWTHPVFSDQPAGLRWYVQLFDGYGETLLDYNHRQTSLGLGLSLFQF
jgi:phospholipase A1/A2